MAKPPLSNAQIYADEMPRRTAVFLILCHWVIDDNARIVRSIDAWNTYAKDPSAASASKTYYLAIESLLTSHGDIDLLLETDGTDPGIDRLRRKAIEPYVHAYVQMGQGVPTPLETLLKEVQTILHRRHLFAEGEAVPTLRPFLFAKGHKRNRFKRVEFEIGGIAKEELRARKAALAVATRAAVQAAPDNLIRGRKWVMASLDWKAVERRSTYASNNAILLTAAVTALVEAFDPTATRFNARLHHPVTRYAANYYRRQGILRRMEISTLMSIVCPMTPVGKGYLKWVGTATADPAPSPDWSFFNGPLVASSTGSNLHLYSPVHLDRLQELSEAFEFPSDSSDAFRPRNDSLAWGETPAKRTDAVDAFVQASTDVQSKMTLVVSTYQSAVISQLTIAHFGFWPPDGHGKKVQDFLDAQEALKDGAIKPPASASHLLAAWNILTAAHALRKTYKELDRQKELTGEEFLKIAKDTKGMVDSLNAYGALWASKSGFFPAVQRLMGVTGLVFTIADLGLAMMQFGDARRTAERIVAAGKVVGAGMLAVAALLGGLRTIPHPAAFVVGLIGQFVLFLVGRFEQDAAAAELRDLLRDSYFSKRNAVTRKNAIFTMWLEELILLHDPAAVAAAARDETGMQSRQVGYFKSISIVVPSSPLDTPEDIAEFYRINRAEMIEDWRWQIAVLYGASGINRIVHTLGITETFDSLRKTVDQGDPARDKTKLPEGTKLEFYDTSHDRRVNAQKFGVTLNFLQALPLWKDGNPGGAEWAAAQHKAINDPTPHPILVSAGGLKRPSMLEARLVFEAPAWVPPAGETAPPLYAVQFVKLV